MARKSSSWHSVLSRPKHHWYLHKCPHTLTCLPQLPRVTLSQQVSFCPEMHPKQTFQDYFPILSLCQVLGLDR